MTKAFKECPYFDSCQENSCPLASDYEKLETTPEDKLLFNYKKCKSRKATRMNIAEKYNLTNKGLTNKEFKRFQKRQVAKINLEQLNLFPIREIQEKNTENNTLKQFPTSKVPESMNSGSFVQKVLLEVQNE